MSQRRSDALICHMLCIIYRRVLICVGVYILQYYVTRVIRQDWALSAKTRNKQAHAVNGNGVAGRVMPHHTVGWVREMG
eukprot:6237936-Amphidinium_carterae.1